MKDAYRASRIKALNRLIVGVAKARKISVELFSDAQVKKGILADGKGTRHSIAEAVAKRFPNDLGLSLPPKRKLWKSEDSRIDVFYATALALTLKLKK